MPLYQVKVQCRSCPHKEISLRKGSAGNTYARPRIWCPLKEEHFNPMKLRFCLEHPDAIRELERRDEMKQRIVYDGIEDPDFYYLVELARKCIEKAYEQKENEDYNPD